MFLCLFAFRNSHWGNRGFRDSAKIPLKKSSVIKNINWTEYAWIDLDNGEKIETTEFLIDGNLVLGKYDSRFNSLSGYFIYNSKSDSRKEFNTRDSFDEYTSANNLPTSDDLQGFLENYDRYWRGWRFLLLP